MHFLVRFVASGLLLMLTFNDCLAGKRVNVALRKGPIQTYNALGQLVNTLPTRGLHWDTAIDNDGNLYALILGRRDIVTLTSGTRVEKYDINGNSLGEIELPGSSTAVYSSIEIGNDGNLYTGRNFRNDVIEKYSVFGDFLGQFASLSTDSAPFEITFDDSGNLYVLASSSIERFDVTGNSLGIFASTASSSISTDMAFDSDGNLYVEIGRSIRVFDPTGDLLRTVDTDINLESIAIDSDDVLYIAGYPSNNAPGVIQKLTLEGSFIGTLVDSLPGPSNGIVDISVVDFIPEPATLPLAAFFALGVVQLNHRKRN